MALAICAWDGNLTYEYLEDLSTQVALHLSGQVLSGEIIPLLFEKSKWMPVAAIGVMKAGGACLALDSGLPPVRLQNLAAESRASLILCSVKNSTLVQQIGAQKSVVVGNDCQWPAGESSVLPQVNPSDKFYVNFTSGSTGIPKGALNTHEAFCSSITYQQRRLGFDEFARVLDFASYSFDATWSSSYMR